MSDEATVAAFFPTYKKHILPKDLLCMVFGYLCFVEEKHYKSGGLYRKIPYVCIANSTVNWIKHGVEVLYDEDGKIGWKTPYVNGKKDGLDILYYDCCNQILHTTPYKDGEKHGVRKQYYKTGEIMWETPHVNGERHGYVKRYHLDGKLQARILFEHGKLIRPPLNK